MDRAIRYSLRIGGGIILLLILLWVALFAIITLKKDSITTMAVNQVNKQISGQITIGDLQSNIFRSFPNIGVGLTDVVIRDSLWSSHHHDFLKAEVIYIRIQLWSLLTGKPRIGKVIVDNCIVYLYIDECGVYNLRRKDHAPVNKGNGQIPEFRFRDTRLIVENKLLNSYHDIELYKLNGVISTLDTATVVDIDINSLVHSIGFNMEKGSYLKEKQLEGGLRLIVHPGNKIALDDVELDIDHHPFVIDGHFNTGVKPATYDLTFQTQKVDFLKAVGLVTESLRSNFDSLAIKLPFDITANVAGAMAYRVIPRVETHFIVADSEMESPFGRFGPTTFTGSFLNQAEPQESPGDQNSQFIFEDLHSSLAGISFTSSKFKVNNLLHPFLNGDIQSNFQLRDLNELTESSTIRFSKGTGSLNVTYEGPFTSKDTIQPSLDGTFTLVDAEINYLPRNLLFKDGTGVVEFNGEDVVIKNLLLTAGSSHLTMNGHVANLLALINVNPEKLVMEWNVSTPDLNLNDFITYVAPAASLTVKKSPSRSRLKEVTQKIDRMLQDGTARLTVSAGKVSYKKFTGTGLNASILLAGNNVFLNDVRLNHGRGVAYLKGTLHSGRNASQLSMTSRLDKVNIPDLFYAFDNFGQDAITHQNLKGTMSANIKMNGALTHKGQVVESSMKGDVDFSLKNGELLNFEPIMKVAEKALKNRDFSKILFGELNSNLSVNGSAITMDEMEIRSNVGVLFVEGLYDTKRGTDMSIRVPVSNLSNEENEDLKNTGRAGVNVRLRAKTGDDGKLNISWDPFNKAAKERNGR